MKQQQNKKRFRSNIRPRDIRLSGSLLRWFLLQTLILIGLGIFTMLTVEPIKHITSQEKIDWMQLAAVIAVWIFVFGVFEILQYRLVKNHLEKISDMIEHLASGNYGAKINITRFDVFKKLAKDLNILSEDLNQVQMFRNDFVNSYSHEFKTPIASINGFAQLLLTDDSLDEATKRNT